MVVELAELCLSPTVVYIDPGATVTFVNRDAMEHNVFGSGFYGDLPKAGDTFLHRFGAAGVYPYTCTLHPGMTGAVVVGDGGIDTAPATDAKQLIAATTDRPGAGGSRGSGPGSGSGGVPVPAVIAGAAALAAAATYAGRKTVRRTA
ncbi:MAG TPA: plastocyanin/azurin family copper-binding protein [Acidimicrobiales bacterium]